MLVARVYGCHRLTGMLLLAHLPVGAFGLLDGISSFTSASASRTAAQGSCIRCQRRGAFFTSSGKLLPAYLPFIAAGLVGVALICISSLVCHSAGWGIFQSCKHRCACVLFPGRLLPTHLPSRVCGLTVGIFCSLRPARV